MKVVVYTSPTCTYCHIVRIFLKRNKIAFDEIDIEENKKAAEDLFRKTGTKTVPVTFVGDNFVVGYDQKKLKALLRL